MPVEYHLARVYALLNLQADEALAEEVRRASERKPGTQRGSKPADLNKPERSGR